MTDAKPASLINIAHDTGVIAERYRISKLIEAMRDDWLALAAQGNPTYFRRKAAAANDILTLIWPKTDAKQAEAQQAEAQQAEPERTYCTQCDDAGTKLERERIVALLEDNIGHGDPDGDSYFMDAIALIKGEVND